MTKEKVNWFYAALILLVLVVLLWLITPKTDSKDMILAVLDIVDILFWGIAVWPFVKPFLNRGQ